MPLRRNPCWYAKESQEASCRRTWSSVREVSSNPGVSINWTVVLSSNLNE